MTRRKIDFDIKKEELNNGLEVVFYKDSSLPLTAVNIWYKVGSANERQGKTGFAHLFEHMMFQGSLNVPREMHFRYIQEAGGTLNGSTSMDRTNYYEKVPSNYLELVLWLESDRMGFLLPALTREKLDNQKDVVMNERRQRYENQPYGRAWELLFSNLYSSDHPYSWPTIGWMEDIAAFELHDISHFFSTYYVPNNASLVVAGDFDENKILDTVKRYFEPIPRGKDIDPIEFSDIPLSKNVFVEHEDNVKLPRLYLAWHSDKLYGPDDAALDFIADILTGSKNARLHKSMVHEKQIAQDVSCFQYSGKLKGTFIIVCTGKPGVSLRLLKEEIFNQLDNIFSHGIKEDELIRAKNSIMSSYIYSLQNLDIIANQINNYNCNLGKPDYFREDLNRYESLVKSDIENTAGKYLSRPYAELHITEKR